MKRYLIILLSIISLAGFSQTTYNVSDGGTVYADSLDHVQPGSISTGNSYTFTICATDGYDEHHIVIEFPSDFNVPAGSNLCVYDGPDVGSPLIACYNNTNFGATHAFMATCSNITGCLTLVLDAQDAGITFDGIVHDHFCCQDIEISLTTNPTMIGQNIDICPGDPVTLTASLSFPTYTALQASGHDWGYTQNTGTCNFDWDLNDGTTANTASVTHTYASVPPSGYGPSLLITDDHGCNNTNVIQPHVRMSLIPNFSGVGANPWTLCQDDPTDLLCGSGPDGGGITSDNWVSYIPPIFADTTFLPDGSGVSYTTSIIFDQFTPFATIDDISLLHGIWVSMEHSYMGDLNIEITCPPPASNTVTLHTFSNGGGTFLGVPIDDDSNLDIGECWDYGWTPNATQTWTAASSSVSTLPSGEYASDETLNNLLGCPLNGQWTITIIDNWGSDNGYICSWWIDWDQSLFPSPWSYSMSYTPVSWTAPQANGEVLSGATGSCNGVGTYHSDLNITSPEPRPFTYTVVDNFGCVYDTTIQVTWLEDDATQCCIDPTPDLGSSDVICGLIYDLHVYNGFSTPGNTGEWAQVSGPGTTTFTPDIYNLNPVIEVSTPGIYTFSWTEVNGGCTTTVNKQVEFKLKPNAYAGADHDICGTHDNLSATSSAAGNTFYWYSVPSGASFGSQTSQNTTVDVTSYGMYSFYVVENNGTCSDTARIKVNFMEIPTAIAYGNDTCGNTALLHADTTGHWGPFYSGYWTGPLGAYYDPSDTAVNVYVTILPFSDPTHAETFTWHVTNGICSDEADVSIIFNNGGPSAYPGNNDQTCLPDYQMHALPSVDGSPTLWSCNDPRLDIDNDQDTATWIHIDPNLIDFTDSSQVEFTLNWTVDNTPTGGCFVTSWITITFFDTPEADAGPDRPICGLCYQLGATPSIASWEGEWTINTDSMPAGASVTFGDGSAAAQTQAVTEVCVTEYGVYQFIWHEQNSTNNTCNDADTVTIEFIRVPEINAGDDDYVCGWRYQMSAQMDASGTSAYGTWQNAPIYWTDSTFYYDTPNTTQPITQDPAQQVRPDALITLPVPEHYCEDSVMMVWQEYSIGTVFSHQCVAKDTTVIHFYADIQADNSTVSVEPEVCGREIDLTNAQDIYCATGYWIDSLGAVVQWDPNDHTPNTTATVGAYITDAFAYVIANGNIPGSNYFVCQDTSDFVTVTFKQKPQVDACPGCYRLEHGITSTGDYVDSVRTDTVCFNNDGEFYILNPQINIGQGTWSKASSGVVFFNGIGSGNISQVENDSLGVVIWNSAGTGTDYYTLVWTGTNSANGCEDKDTLLLSIAKNPSGNIGFRRPYCNGESAKVWAEPDNDANPTDWNWQFTDSPIIDSTESGPWNIIDSLKQGAHYVRWTNSGDCDELDHVATLVSSSDWGCFSSSNTETIKEPGIVYPQFDNIAATCGQNNGMIKVIKDTITVCGDTIDHTILTCWQSSSLVQDDQNGIPAFSDQINYGSNCVIDSIYGVSPYDTSVIAVDYISLITLDPGYVGPQVHCKDTLVLRVEDSGHIEAVIDDGRMDDLNPDVTHIGGNLSGTAPLDVTLYHGTLDASKYNWIIRDEEGNIIYDSNDEYPTYTFPQGNYEIDLVVKSREGCYDTTAYRFIMVDSESFIEIPNLFTPNGDGTNDYFQVYAKSLKAFKGFIMNRWGKVLYEWDDWTTEDAGWDGKINGNNYAAPGVYFYVIRYKGVYDDAETEVKGSLELVREKE